MPSGQTRRIASQVLIYDMNHWWWLAREERRTGKESPISTLNHTFNMESPTTEDKTPAVRSRHITAWCTDKQIIINNHLLT